MAWAIRADGVDDQMSFTSVTIPAGENFTIRIAASLDDLINRSFAGQSGAFNNVIRTASASQWKFRANAVESNLDFIEPLVDFAVFDVEIKRTGGATGTIDIVDTATQSSLLVATVNNPNELALNGLFRYGNSSFRFLGEFQLLEITSTTVNNKWDATASDHSNTGAQPVLVDTVGSNDATGSGFPTDGSAWVDLGGGGVTLDGLFSINKDSFLSSASASLPQPVGDASFNINSLLLNASASVTLPNPQGDISFIIPEISIGLSGGATLPQPISNISFSFPKVSLTASASVTVPFPVGNVAFSIDSQGFISTGSATQPNPSASVAFSINNISVISSASVSLPQPISNISFNVDSVIVSATGSATQTGFNADIAFDIDSLLFASSASVTLPNPIADMSFSIDYSIIATGSSSGAPVNSIGAVTARFADDEYSASFKPNQITVSFKS